MKQIFYLKHSILCLQEQTQLAVWISPDVKLLKSVKIKRTGRKLWRYVNYLRIIYSAL